MPALIAHVLPFSEVGGTEIATLRLAEAARRQGFSNIAYHPHHAAPVQELFARNGFATEGYDDQIYLSIHNFRRWVGAMRNMASSFRAHGVSILHLSDVRAATLVAPAGRLAGLPVLCHVRNRLDALPLAERLPLKAVGRFVFVSAATWKQFCYHVPEDRGIVLYDGIDLPQEDEQSSSDANRRAVIGEFSMPSDTVLVTMIARIAPQKDYLTLVQAAAQVVALRPEVRFMLVGGSAVPLFEEQVRQWIRGYGLDSHIYLAGFRSDIPRLLAASDIFLLSTHFEGLPLVILEAMAQGKPVVATGVDGILEIVKPGETGLLCGHQQADELAKNLLGLVESPTLRQTLGASGRHMVSQHFSTSHFEQSTGRLYRSLLS